MDRLTNKIIFIVLAPIFGPLMIFSHVTYPWWHGLFKKGTLAKIIFFALSPIYGPVTLFLHLTYDWWADKGKAG